MNNSPESLKTELINLAITHLQLTAKDAESLVVTTQLRNLCICQEYDERRAKGEKAEYLYCDIGNRYFLSYLTTRDIIHNRNDKEQGKR